MEFGDVARIALGALIGGIAGLAFAQVTIGSRVTRLETQMELLLEAFPVKR